MSYVRLLYANIFVCHWFDIFYKWYNAQNLKKVPQKVGQEDCKIIPSVCQKIANKNSIHKIHSYLLHLVGFLLNMVGMRHIDKINHFNLNHRKQKYRYYNALI